MDNVYKVLRGGFSCRKGQKKSPQDKTLSRQEFAALLETTSSDTTRHGIDAYDLFAVTGNFCLRCSEAIDLTQDDFKPLVMGYFRVRTLKKGGHQEDRVYVDQAHRDLLRSMLLRRKSDRIFPFTSRTARYLFAYYAERAGISPNVSFHSLRHTAAKMMLTAISGKIEYPERVVNAFLRHKPMATEIYLTPSAEDMTRAIGLKGAVR